MQLVRIGYNLMKLIDSLNLLSPLTYPAWILALLIAVPTKVRNYFPEKLQIPAVSMLLFPLGFLLINFEPRYIWYTYPIILVIAALGVQKLLPLIERPILKWMVLFLFGLSFVTGPVWQLKPLIHTGKEEFQLAAAWKEAGIIGSFTTNGTDGKSHQKAARLAYFSGNPYFLIPANQLDTKSEMHQEIERYHIRYFVYLPDGNHEIGTFSLLDKNGLPYPLVWQGRGGIKVYQLFSTED